MGETTLYDQFSMDINTFQQIESILIDSESKNTRSDGQIKVLNISLRPSKNLQIVKNAFLVTILSLISIFQGVSTQATVAEITSLTIPTNKVVTHITLLKESGGATTPIYLTVDDPFVRDITGTLDTNTTLANPLSIKCYEDSETCLVSGNLVIQMMNKTATGFSLEKDQFVFLKEFKADPKVYSMEIEPIHTTVYFLSFITSHFGVLRYKHGTFDKFGLVETIEDFKNDRFARGLLAIQGSAIGLASVHQVDKIFSFDMTLMTKIAVHELAGGKLKELTLDRSAHFVAKGGDETLSVFKYSDGVEAVSLNVFYFISDIETIFQSNFIITAEDNILKFYTFDGTSVLVETLTHNLVQTIYAVEYDIKTSQVFAGGLELGKVLEINTPSAAECHPSCQGGCSKGFSPSACTSCAAGTTDQSGTCLQDTPTLPDKDQAGYASTAWSEEDTGLFTSVSPTILETAIAFATKYWMYFAIGFGALCLLCIMSKLCCSGKKKDNEDEQDQERSRIHDEERQKMRQQRKAAKEMRAKGSKRGLNAVSPVTMTALAGGGLIGMGQGYEEGSAKTLNNRPRPVRQQNRQFDFSQSQQTNQQPRRRRVRDSSVVDQNMNQTRANLNNPNMNPRGGNQGGPRRNIADLF